MQELAGGQLRGGITSEKGFANSMGQPKEDAHQQHLGAALLHARPPLALNFLMLSAPALTNVCSMGWAARARTLCGAGAAGRCSAVMPSVQAGDAHVAGTDDRASASPGPSRHTPAPHPPPRARRLVVCERGLRGALAQVPQPDCGVVAARYDLTRRARGGHAAGGAGRARPGACHRAEVRARYH